MEAIILAAGRGIRFGILTADTPKPLLKLARKPIIERLLREAVSIGISRFYISVGYLGEQIEAYLGDGNSLGAEIVYCHPTTTTPESAFMAGFRHVEGKDFFCLCGDTFIGASALYALYGQFCVHNADGVFAIDAGNESNSNRVAFDDCGNKARITRQTDDNKAVPVAYDFVIKTEVSREFDAGSSFVRQFDPLAHRYVFEAADIPISNINTVAEYEALNQYFIRKEGNCVC